MLMLSPLAGSDLGAASAAITQLQQALVGLAQTSGRPAINPGTIDGILGNNTMMAVAAAHQILAEKAPKDYLVLALNTALIFGSTTSQAKAVVTSYAPQLTIAIKAATAGYATGIIPKPSTTPPTQFLMYDAQLLTPGGGGGGAAAAAATPWYKTWWGIGAIAVGAFGAYKFLTAPAKAA